MQDVRSVNPYIKRIRYLSEINRLKRITLFLRTVQSLANVSGSEHYARRQHQTAEIGVDQEERSFIEDCRFRLQAIAAAEQFHEVNHDVLCRYLIRLAARAAERRVPMIGDCNRIRDLASMYHDGDIKQVITGLSVTYTRQAAQGQNTLSVSLLISLTRRGALKVTGYEADLRRRVRAILPKPEALSQANSQAFLAEAVAGMLAKAPISGWELQHVAGRPDEYAVLADGALQPLTAVFPSALVHTSGFYEQTWLREVINDLPVEQQKALGKFLRPYDYDGDIAKAVNWSDSEDTHRVLLYLRRLKR